MIVVAAIGATIGQTALCLLAKRGGREYLFDWRWFRISAEQLDRWGPLSVVASNSLPFTRGMLTDPAGFARMGLRRFVVVSALGTIVFQTLLALLTIGVLESL